MHTLCLLDIKVKEPDYDHMMRGKGIKYRPPRFMTVRTTIIVPMPSMCEDMALDSSCY